jgi:UPF0176 protein
MGQIIKDQKETNRKISYEDISSSIEERPDMSYRIDEDIVETDVIILKYLEEVPPENSLWQGECFVFDQRVAVKHGLEVGDYDQCYACRYPLSPDDIKSEKYTPGISCPHCYNTHTPEKLKSLTERQRQVILAKQRGTHHIGG